MDAFPLPVEGTETRVNAGAGANEFMVTFTETCERIGPLDIRKGPMMGDIWRPGAVGLGDVDIWRYHEVSIYQWQHLLMFEVSMQFEKFLSHGTMK